MAAAPPRLLAGLAALSCWNAGNPLKAGGGTGIVLVHDVVFGGFKHADGYCLPLVNCVACHGSGLQGGTNGQPACTKCHGTIWTSPNCGQNSHTQNLGGVYHAPNYCKPSVNCSACHGAGLQGGRPASRRARNATATHGTAPPAARTPIP